MDKRLLLIAYACEPGKGSEQNVGWNWALHLSRVYDVTVLTRANNRLVIEEVLKENPDLNLRFIFFDIIYFRTIKKIIPFGVQLYSILWELFCVKAISGLHFDLIQRLTMVSLTSLFPYKKCQARSIAGFYSGGDRSPDSLKSHYCLRFQILECLRSFYYRFITRCLLRNELEGTSAILAVTEATIRLLKQSINHHHMELFPAIGIDRMERMNPSKKGLHGFQILYGGDIKYHKNVDLLIKAFARSGLGKENVRFVIVGDGPDKKRLQRLKQRLKCSGIQFIPSIDRQSYLHILKDSHLFTFAASRDSGGLALLEAIGYDVPVMLLNTGGPAEIFRGIPYSFKLSSDTSYDELICKFSEKFKQAVNNYNELKKEYRPIREKILSRYLWVNKAEQMIQLHRKLTDEDSSGS